MHRTDALQFHSTTLEIEDELGRNVWNGARTIKLFFFVRLSYRMCNCVSCAVGNKGR